MKRIIILIISFFIISCNNNQEAINLLQNEIKHLKGKNDSLTKRLNKVVLENKELKNTPFVRFQKIKNFLKEGDIDKARIEIDVIRAKYPDSREAKKSKIIYDSIIEQQKKQKLEEKRKKELGFKALPVKSKTDYAFINMNVISGKIQKRWIFDDYGDTYYYNDAVRGSKILQLNLNISSESHNPDLPLIIACKANGEKLSYLGTLEYKFRRWRDYGSYLGNYSDAGNDFAQSKIVKFTAGLSIEDSEVKERIYVLAYKNPCVGRKEERFENPPVSYSNSRCNDIKKYGLTLDEVEEYFNIIKVFN